MWRPNTAENPTKSCAKALDIFATCSWPSLCSQSEGGRIMRRPNTAKNPTKSCPKALVIFATCSWPSLCEQSELQCWRRNRRLCGPAQISAARTLLPISTVLSQVAWRLRRCKRHRANIRRRSEAKHCSSLCSQSEGDEYCGGQTRLKIQQSHALKR